MWLGLHLRKLMQQGTCLHSSSLFQPSDSQMYWALSREGLMRCATHFKIRSLKEALPPICYKRRQPILPVLLWCLWWDPMMLQKCGPTSLMQTMMSGHDWWIFLITFIFRCTQWLRLRKGPYMFACERWCSVWSNWLYISASILAEEFLSPARTHKSMQLRKITISFYLFQLLLEIHFGQSPNQCKPRHSTGSTQR